MVRGEYRRSPRIIELDARKAHARSQNKGNEICEVMDGEESDKGQSFLKQKHRRKKVKVRTVQDLIVNSVEYKVQKTDIGNDEECVVNAAIVSSGAALPSKSKLELLLGILQRRDTRKIFAEPVNPEEVECYYDIIKEPMDFGTIAKKLNEGSYQTLDEFEHDVFLISNNAMLFNASNTVYYRQARALKELATRLFHALKTDPENFEAEASMRRTGLGRTKAEVYSNNKTSLAIAARGSRAERQSDDFEVEKRRTYKPWNSFLNENGSLVSAVYNSPKQLKLDDKVGLGYVASLKQFANNLGATAQVVAMKKVESYIAEALKVWNMTTNRQSWAPEMPIPNSTFAPKGIKVAPSFKVPSTTPGFQNMSGDKTDIHSIFSNGGQALTHETMDITNALNRGINQPGKRAESLGDFRGKATQSANGDLTPSLHLLGNSNGSQMFAGETINGSSSFWNGGKVSIVNKMDINDALNKGKPGDRMDFQGKVAQTMKGGLDSGAAFKDNSANQSNGHYLYSSFPNYDSGKGKLDITASWNMGSNQKDLSMSSMMLDAVNVDNTVQTAGQPSLGSRMEEFTPTRFSVASSSSSRPPSQVMTGLNSRQAIDHMSGIGSHNLGRGVCQKEATAAEEGSRYRINLDQGGQVSDWFKPVEMGLQSLAGYGFQEQNVSTEMASLLQQKSELDSLCKAPPLEDWLVSFQREQVIGASSNSYPSEYERFQSQSKGESSSGAAAADRRQKQPMVGKELPQWLWL